MSATDNDQVRAMTKERTENLIKSAAQLAAAQRTAMVLRAHLIGLGVGAVDMAAIRDRLIAEFKQGVMENAPYETEIMFVEAAIAEIEGIFANPLRIKNG